MRSHHLCAKVRVSVKQKKKMTSFSEFYFERWPIVCISLVRTPNNDDEIKDFQDKFCGLLHLAVHGDPGVRDPCSLSLVMNLDGLVDASYSQQLQAVSFIQDVKPLVQAGALKSTALIVTSEGARRILEIILELAPLTSKHALFTNEEEGLAWVISNS